jgi:hypothetical protein
VQDEDRDAARAPAEPDRRNESPDSEMPTQASAREESRDAEAPTAADQPAEDAGEDRERSWRPIRGLGAVGCLTMILATAAAIALLSTGNFFAGVAGILIFAVAIGVGLWLYNAGSAPRK